MNFFKFPAGLNCLYKLSTSKIFEKNTNSAVENSETNGKDVQSEGSSSAGCESSTLSMADLDCHAVNKIELCVRSRTLLVAGTSHVIVYQFSISEETLELVVSSNELEMMHRLYRLYFSGRQGYSDQGNITSSMRQKLQRNYVI